MTKLNNNVCRNCNSNNVGFMVAGGPTVLCTDCNAMYDVFCYECERPLEDGEKCVQCALEKVPNKGEFMNKDEQEAFVNAWLVNAEKEGLLEAALPDRVEEIKSMYYDTREYYIWVGHLEADKANKSNRGASAPREDLNEYGLKSITKRSGYMKYVCNDCGAEYDYEPAYCYEKDEVDGCPCYSSSFDFVHGPFEGIYMANQEAITTGNFQGLARHSIFEEGCSFNDVVVHQKDGTLVGFMSEENAVAHARAEEAYGKLGMEYFVGEQAKRAELYKNVDKCMEGLVEYFGKASLKEFGNRYPGAVAFKELQQKAIDKLQVVIKRQFGEESFIFRNGMPRSKEVIVRGDKETKRNGILFANYKQSIYSYWDNNRVKKNKNDYVITWSKWETILKDMPGNVNNKAELIENGWFNAQLDKHGLGVDAIQKIMTHARYLKNSDNKNHIESRLYGALGRQMRKANA